MNFLMDFRLEGVALDILVKKLVVRDFTAATKSIKNSSPLTYDSRMGLGLSEGRNLTSHNSQTPYMFAMIHFSIDPTPATHRHTRHINYLHTP
ncbi:Bgt-20311 [Blumeria graminis f. sp. tritici]|uniref:Bgt-20311 n=2 Tax=Blumeria graminis f. sp. tritici TaxID=62690 RepID=A0A9X9QG64_BLUGR|nr:Bgt-20311 [Blumeria graminis f. sp. tritici]